LLDVEDLVSNSIRYSFSLKTNPSLTEKQNSRISQNYEKIRIYLQEFLEDTHRQSCLPIIFDARTDAWSGDNISVIPRQLSLSNTISVILHLEPLMKSSSNKSQNKNAYWFIMILSILMIKTWYSSKICFDQHDERKESFFNTFLFFRLSIHGNTTIELRIKELSLNVWKQLLDESINLY
jgi:hypothetical protein